MSESFYSRFRKGNTFVSRALHRGSVGPSGETNQEAARRLGYELVSRQTKLFTWWCDLYPPSGIRVGKDGQAASMSRGTLPKYRFVPCYKIESQEDNEIQAFARANYDIALTIDQFKFAAGQEIEDGWLIALYPPGGAASDREHIQCYVTQGGAQDKPSTGIRETNQRKLFAKKTNTPTNLQASVPADIQQATSGV